VRGLVERLFVRAVSSGLSSVGLLVPISIVGGIAEQLLARLADLFDAHRQYAARLIERVAAVAGTWIAGKIILRHARRRLPWPPMHRTAGTENRHHRALQRRRQVHRPGIVAHKQLRSGNQRNQFRAARGNRKPWRTRAHLLAHPGFPLLLRPDPESRMVRAARRAQPVRQRCKFIHRPALGKIASARLQDGVCAHAGRFRGRPDSAWPPIRPPRLGGKPAPRERSARHAGPIELRGAMLGGVDRPVAEKFPRRPAPARCTRMKTDVRSNRPAPEFWKRRPSTRWRVRRVD
jgi:hypothetical protein